MSRYLVALDQGTTSSRCVIFDRQGQVCSVAKVPFKQFYPQPGWVEHDPEALYRTTCHAMKLAMAKLKATPSDLIGIGLANQRETVMIWDKRTGKPVYPAIVWQCRRTAQQCHELRDQGLEPEITAKTGLVLDAYFSATKLQWILNHVPGVRAAAQAGQLLAGTVDTWLIWKLTAGRIHATDVTNASRTLLYNLHTQDWDPDLLECFGIPRAMLPEIKPSVADYGAVWDEAFQSNVDWASVPICGVAGDQQAALLGQLCIRPGRIKATYGTGCFLLTQTGPFPVFSKHRLLTTVAWDLGQGPCYALEGSVFHAGSTLQWLKDELGILQTDDEIEDLAAASPPLGDLVLVPAFTGLGAPYWNMEARGLLLGVTRGTNRAQLCRAALEATAHQVTDVFNCMAQDCREAGVWPQTAEPLLRVDGGGSVSDLLLQEQANLLGFAVERASVVETTARGVAFLVGLKQGIWPDLESLEPLWTRAGSWRPQGDPQLARARRKRWAQAVETALYAGRLQNAASTDEALSQGLR